jgi:hypothetical protein
MPYKKIFEQQLGRRDTIFNRDKFSTIAKNYRGE